MQVLSGSANGVETMSRRAYKPPTIRILSEDEVLMAFQMTAAEISAAGCWWGACPTGCP